MSVNSYPPLMPMYVLEGKKRVDLVWRGRSYTSHRRCESLPHIAHQGHDGGWTFLLPLDAAFLHRQSKVPFLPRSSSATSPCLIHCPTRIRRRCRRRSHRPQPAPPLASREHDAPSNPSQPDCTTTAAGSTLTAPTSHPHTATTA